MGLHGVLSDFKVNLPVLGVVSGVGIVAILGLVFLLRRKKTISFKV